MAYGQKIEWSTSTSFGGVQLIWLCFDSLILIMDHTGLRIHMVTLYRSIILIKPFLSLLNKRKKKNMDIHCVKFSPFFIFPIVIIFPIIFINTPHHFNHSYGSQKSREVVRTRQTWFLAFLGLCKPTFHKDIWRCVVLAAWEWWLAV